MPRHGPASARDVGGVPVSRAEIRKGDGRRKEWRWRQSRRHLAPPKGACCSFFVLDIDKVACHHLGGGSVDPEDDPTVLRAVDEYPDALYWLEQVVDVRDRRLKYLTLTDRGREVAQTIVDQLSHGEISTH